MSWDTYVKQLVDSGLVDAAIAGVDNGAWLVTVPNSKVILRYFKVFRLLFGIFVSLTFG